MRKKNTRNTRRWCMFIRNTRGKGWTGGITRREKDHRVDLEFNSFDIRNHKSFPPMAGSKLLGIELNTAVLSTCHNNILVREWGLCCWVDSPHNRESIPESWTVDWFVFYALLVAECVITRTSAGRSWLQRSMGREGTEPASLSFPSSTSALLVTGVALACNLTRFLANGINTEDWAIP